MLAGLGFGTQANSFYFTVGVQYNFFLCHLWHPLHVWYFVVYAASSSRLYWLQIQLKSWSVEHFYTVFPYRYIGCEYGMVSVLKYDPEGRRIMQLPYCVPTNIIAGNCYIRTIGWCWRQNRINIWLSFLSEFSKLQITSWWYSSWR